MADLYYDAHADLGRLAGRPIAIRYVDNRELEKHSGQP